MKSDGTTENEVSSKLNLCEDTIEIKEDDVEEVKQEVVEQVKPKYKFGEELFEQIKIWL